jgi:hypothetical protein
MVVTPNGVEHLMRRSAFRLLSLSEIVDALLLRAHPRRREFSVNEKGLHMRFETHAKITIALAILAAFAGVLNFLALTDIYHHEADVSLEWRIVRYSNLVFLLFLCSSVSTVCRALRARSS